MSEIEGHIGRIGAVLDKPVMRLLDRSNARFALAVFRTSFGQGIQAVPSERLHGQVDAYMTELRGAGHSLTLKPSGRAQCLQWVKDQWLYRSPGDGGNEEYALTSHALEALTFVENNDTERALINESRISTIVAVFRRLATEANPDRQVRIDRLTAEIDQLTVERDRLLGGGDIDLADDDRMLNGYSDVMDLLSQLPSDFRRVEESFIEMHRNIVGQIRAEKSSRREILDEYLNNTDTLMSATAEGKAFEGAFELLRDESVLTDLKADLVTLVNHPAAAALHADEQANLRAGVAVIRGGLSGVLERRSKLTATLREHIVKHDIVKDRELDAALRETSVALEEWMQTAGPNAKAPVFLAPAEFKTSHFKPYFWDPEADAPPPPLEDVSGDAPDPLDMDELRTHGGPMLREYRKAIVDAAHADGTTSASSLFNTADKSLRRPVEVLGLLQLATWSGALNAEADEDKYESIRPDGTRRTFHTSGITFGADHIAALAALDEENTHG